MRTQLLKFPHRRGAGLLRGALRRVSVRALLRALPAVLGVGFGTGLHAQALPTAKGPGSRVEVGAGISGFQNPYGQQRILGTTFYASINPHWRYGLLGEVRMLNRNTSNDVSMSTYMGGLKVAILPHPGRFEPYAKMMVGVGHVVLPFRYAQGNFLTYAPGGGVDISLGDYIKFRAVDVEYQKWQNFPYGNLQPFGVTTGFTIRLNPLHRYPEEARHRGRIEK